MGRHSFKVGQYNVLADCLADNLKPWFWYGYAGVEQGRPYRDDGLDAVRVEVFGCRRSDRLIEFWILMKRFFKIFHTDFEYILSKRTFPEDAPGSMAIPLLHKALVDFFRRNNATSPEGNKDLPYHLFRRDDREYLLWQSVVQPLGLDIKEDGWPNLDRLRGTIEAEADPVRKQSAIDAFNAAVRNQLAPSDQALSERLGSVARLVCPSDRDLADIFRVQASWAWPLRSATLFDEIHTHSADVWGFVELDDVEGFRRRLGTDHYRLAAFKLRAIFPKEDGAGIFYNEKVFRLMTSDGGACPLVSCVRFSGSVAAVQGKALSLRRFAPRYRDGVILSENEGWPRDPPPEEAGDATVPAYVFTDRLKPNDKDFFDERIAVFAALQHISSGVTVVVVSTHFYHTQDDPFYEDIRAHEARQLTEAVRKFCHDMSMSEVPVVLLGDLNDVPDVAIYGRPSQATPMYRAFVEEGGWTDPSDASQAPTTFTLRRQFPIDYILLRQSGAEQPPFPSAARGYLSRLLIALVSTVVLILPLGRWLPQAQSPLSRASPTGHRLTCEVDPPRKVQLVGRDANGHLFLLPNRQTEGAVVGPPLTAVGTQPAIPSDHVPLTGTIRFDAP